ncbi:glutamate receptor 1-like [Pieris napi]|uniref:glutamate receptor 1-like n=1 Tax=Pieris napi TaxID=78633 RepID=UPI001FB8B3B6|nr:glutamate receptor 1-like [Pieris napi]
MDMSKDRKTAVEFQIYINIIDTADVFKLSRLICSQYTRGAIALIGSVPSDSFHTLHSYSNSFQMPFVIPWFSEKMIPKTPRGKDYALSLRPDFHRAVFDTIVFYGWTDVIYIYDSHDGLRRLQSIFSYMQPGSEPFRIIQVRRVAKAKEVIDYLIKLEAVDSMSLEKRFVKKYIVLDSSTDIAKETVKLHASCDELERTPYHYLLSGSVMDEDQLWSENVHNFENLDITGFQVIDYSKKKVKDFMENWKWHTHVSTEAAMIVDSANLVIEGILRLVRKKPEFLRASTRRSVPPNVTDIEECNIEEEGIIPFEFGEKLARTIRRTEIDGLTGFIRFDEAGHRINFTLRIVEITAGSKSQTVGTWYDYKGVEKPNKVGLAGPSEINKTYIIICVEEEPYIMPLVDNRSKKKWKGFSVELAEMIMKKLGLKYELRLVKDGKFGQENPEVAGGWDGIIGELIRKEADLSISSLTANVQRKAVIDFSRTLLSFETVAVDEPLRFDSFFSFFQPFSKEIWFSIFGSMLAVSFSLYIVSKFSSSEYEVQLSSNEDTESSGVQTLQANVKNTFTLWNAIWFSLGSFMQQTSGYTPRSISGRIVSGVWWFLALFVMIMYTANLTTHLTLSQLNPPLNMINRAHKCPAESNKPCDMLISVMETGLQDFAVAFPKGSPLREGVNLALLKLKDDGELHRLIRIWFMPLSCKNKIHGKEISLSQIAGLFLILLGGLGLGLIISFIEYIVHRRKKHEQPINPSPLGTPVRSPDSPVMRSIMKPSTHRSQNERETIDWNAANYAVYGSPSHHEFQEETPTHETFRQV